MLYDYQYDVVAIINSVAMLFVFMFRKVPLEKSGKYFLRLLALNIMTAVLDIVSIFAISDINCMPLWMANVSALGYLLIYNYLNVIYFGYIDSKCKLPGIQTLSKWLMIFMYVFYGALIVSSPYTHWIAYFDEAGNYCHGPLMNALYGIPFIFFALEILMMIKARKNFNPYQVITAVVFNIAMVISVLISVLIPRALVGSMATSVVLMVLYLAFENPAYYSFKDTACLNAYAFDKYLRREEKHGKLSQKRFLLIVLTNRDAMKIQHGVSVVNRLDVQFAIALHKKYKQNIFQYVEGCYILVTQKKHIEPTKDEILELLQKVHKGIDIDTLSIDDIWPSETCNDVEKLLDYRITHLRPEYKAMNSEEFMTKIEAKEKEKQTILYCIRKALERKRFNVYYQPIYDCRMKSFRSAEALIRLVDDEHGFINPETLITVAEEFGYINEITEIVLDKVCRFLNETDIQKYGIEYIEVNLSPICCRERDMLKKVIFTMKKNRIPYNMINFEITETADMQNDAVIERTLRSMHDIGMSLSIDDYGSGFASPDYLIKMPISIVKIDKEILWAAMKDVWAMHILESNVKMIKALEKGVVVEGVENQAMLDVLTSIEPDLFIQGYLFSKPIPEEAYLEFMKKAAVNQ